MKTAFRRTSIRQRYRGRIARSTRHAADNRSAEKKKKKRRSNVGNSEIRKTLRDTGFHALFPMAAEFMCFYDTLMGPYISSAAVLSVDGGRKRRRCASVSTVNGFRRTVKTFGPGRTACTIVLISTVRVAKQL